MKIKEFLLQKVNKDTLKKESVHRAIKVTICSAFIFALIIQLVGCLFSPMSVYALEDDSLIGTWVFNDNYVHLGGNYNFSITSGFDAQAYFRDSYTNTTSLTLMSVDQFNYSGNAEYANAIQLRHTFNSSSFTYRSWGYNQGDTWEFSYSPGGGSTIHNQDISISQNSNVAILIINSHSLDDATLANVLAVLNANATKQDEPSSCPSLDELLQDYSGSFSDIVGMLNATNLQEYRDSIPTLPDYLRDYTGSFDSIVDMLNSTNYDQYEESIRFFEERAYNEGVSASFGENLLGATFNAPLTALNQWVLFETTGGIEITMGGVFSGLLALSILIILIKMFAGG